MAMQLLRIEILLLLTLPLYFGFVVPPTLLKQHHDDHNKQNKYLFSAASPRRLGTTTSKQDTDRLLSWTLGGNATIASIRPSTIPGCGNGLFINQKISKNQFIMRIPAEKVITLEDAFEHDPLGDAFLYLTDEGGPGGKVASLAGFVALEQLLSSNDLDSKWQPYFNCLPSSSYQNHVLWWNTTQIETLLQNSNIYDQVIDMREQVDIAIQNIQEIYQYSSSSQDENDKETTTGLLSTSVRSAFCTLLSRAFEDEEIDCMKLIPVLDMTQHHDMEKVNIRHATDSNTGDILVTASRDLEAGEELFNCYSTTLKPQEFFPVFGFVPNEKGLAATQLLESKDSIFFSAY